MTEQTTEPPDPVGVLQRQLDQANQRLIEAELKSHALHAGIIDLDCLKMLDMSGLRLDEHGRMPGAEPALARLKRDKPWAFSKPNSSHPAAAPAAEPVKVRTAKEMTHREWQIARERLIQRR